MTVLSPVTETSAVVDNRRATVRIMTYEVIRGLASLSRLDGGDMIKLLVFSGIWTANTQHLINERVRYAALHDVPPDSQRRPIPQDVLCDQICMPADIVARYVDQLIAEGVVERLPGGLVVPSAVFLQPHSIAGANEIYSRAMSMVIALRGAGFQLGETG